MRANYWTRLVGAIFCILVLQTSAKAQVTREQAYTFKVPIHLKDLPPGLNLVVLHCYASLTKMMRTDANTGSHHEMQVRNAQLDTVVAARLQVQVPASDQGSAGKYYCDIYGRASPTDRDHNLTPDAPEVAFRLTPALKQIMQEFVW